MKCPQATLYKATADLVCDEMNYNTTMAFKNELDFSINKFASEMHDLENNISV